MRDEKTVISNMRMAFNTLFKWEKSESLRDIWREVYGDDYPEEVNHDGYVTMSDLKKIVSYLDVGPSETIIDVGCGRGGPGFWIARELGANYVGFDLSDIAVEVAVKRAIDFGLKDKASFQVGNICETNFPDNYFDGAISIDTLGFVSHKLTAVCEVARILRSDALFVFTTWEEKLPNKVNDYRPLLREAGFKVFVYNETPDWERRQREVYQKVLESKKILIKDMGRDAARIWIKEAKTYLPLLKYTRRILAVAKKI